MRELARDDYHFFQIRQIHDRSFHGIERPNEWTLRYQFDHCELFTQEVFGVGIVSYAMVTAGDRGPFLWSLATAKEFRGQGIAATLIEELLAYYRDKHAGQIELTVNSENPAQKLYFDHGFRVVQVLPRYYGEIAGLRMRRTL